MNTDTNPASEPSLQEAIDEQQTRVWRLRSLIECVSVVGDGGRGIDDPDAAIEGLVDYADAIHSALDFEALTKRAGELAREKVDMIRRDQAGEGGAE